MNRRVLQSLRVPSRLRLAATLLCLLACTLQSFVAQTHVHRARAGAPAGYSADVFLDQALLALTADDDDSPRHNRRDGSSTCPLCQIVLHGGAAPAPAFALFLSSLRAASVAPAEEVPPGPSVAVSFNWQGRAPPLA